MITPEDLGRAVRRIWVATVLARIPDPKPSWVAGFDDLDDFQRTADIAIGVGIARLAWLALSSLRVMTAVQLTDDANWETLAAWSGGRLRSRECAVPGEYETELVMPGGAVAVEGDWLVMTPAGLVITREVLASSPWLPHMPVTLLREMYARSGPGGGLMPSAPTADVPPGIRDAQMSQLEDEAAALRDALRAGNLEGIAGGVAGVIIAAAGTGAVHGLPVDALVAEVHASNMSRAAGPGTARPAGGPGCRPPRITAVLADAAGTTGERRGKAM